MVPLLLSCLFVVSIFKDHCCRADVKGSDFSTKILDSTMSLQRLSALRSLMASQPAALAAYIVPTADAHHSEYISPTDARREWISGFTGSAGTAVVTDAHALVWTDGRYYTQFEKEVDNARWTLMKQSLPETPTLEKWLTSNLSVGAVVGVDPYTITHDEWTPLQTALTKANMQLVAVPTNLVDAARAQLNEPPPPRPSNAIYPLPLKYTGRKAGQKIEELREKMAEKKTSSLIITALDEVAYTLNLRGSDIQYNPVFYAYLVITPSTVTLYAQGARLSDAAREQLSNEDVTLTVAEYCDAAAAMAKMAKADLVNGEKPSIWMSGEASEAVYRAASGTGVLETPLNVTTEVSPVALMKQVKNDVELEGFRNCHIRDGTAVVRFLRWLESRVHRGDCVTEIQAADKLLEFRKEEADFMGPSFETIAGAGANGAIIHYSPSRDGVQTRIAADDMFLLDSGGQYRDGTTDITRTRHMGTPSADQVDAFTRVLQGQMKVGAMLFPMGVKGNVLDSFAREALWLTGRDYAHGTGHGVGHHLNVHEGPGGVSWRPYPNDPGVAAGHILSNEPGYYEVGHYGIRHEDLVEVIAVTKDSNHPRASGLKGDFNGRGVLGFSTLTMVPHQAKCIDVCMLNDFELNYLNAYHRRVLNTLSPVLRQRGLLDELEWLEKECQPLTRN